jgi:hypothetical protein
MDTATPSLYILCLLVLSRNQMPTGTSVGFVEETKCHLERILALLRNQNACLNADWLSYGIKISVCIYIDFVKKYKIPAETSGGTTKLSSIGGAGGGGGL